MRCLSGYGMRSSADTTLPVQPVRSPQLQRSQTASISIRPRPLIVWVGLLGYRRSGNVVPDVDKHPSAIGG